MVFFKIMKTVFKLLLFVFIFFFGEVAFIFSDKASLNQLRTEENFSFAHALDNKYSEHESMAVVDNYINLLLKYYRIKGASVAICKNDKLIYAKGLGLANAESNEEMRPDHLFRVASVSKLITAVAIMKLYEQGKLSLDDKVFGPDGILNDSTYLTYTDKKFEKITVRHLLNHTGGWSGRFSDPMFNSLNIARKYNIEPPADIKHVIRYALERRLSFEPGTVYSYSNLGYGILGEIIAMKSGMLYEDYVIFNILKPFGLHDFHLGKSFYHEKFPNEVRYYDPVGTPGVQAFNGSDIAVPPSYGGNNIELLAAAGGWIASAPELARFLLALDPAQHLPLILKRETLRMMTDPNIAGQGLFGWRGVDDKGSIWRTGTLSGSASLIMRQSNGTTWVVLLNGSAGNNGIHSRISNTMFNAQKKVSSWPEYDLFTMIPPSAGVILRNTL
jgi:CubicO group peptidase (beta-lactamase class C family)